MSQLKQTFYRLVTTAWNSGLPFPGADRGDCVSIVCLHGVHTPEMERICPPPSSSVSASSFEANLRALGRHHRVISLAHAVDMLLGRCAWESHCAVLTFDDSLKCTVDVAFPILSRLGMTATVFVSTTAIETGLPYWWLQLDHAFHRAKRPEAEVNLPVHGKRMLRPGDVESLSRLKSALRKSQASPRDAAIAAIEEQLGVALQDLPRQFPYATTLSWDDARAAIRNGFSVGSHTVTHPNLTLLSPEELAFELTVSRKNIEAQTGAPCRHFCYPYGAMNPEVAGQAAASGYEAATSTIAPGKNRLGQDLFALRRYSIPAAPLKLGYMLSGFPEAIGAAKASLGLRPATVQQPTRSTLANRA